MSAARVDGLRRLGLALAFLPVLSMADWGGVAGDWSPSSSPDWAMPYSAAPVWSDDAASRSDEPWRWSGAGNGDPGPAAGPAAADFGRFKPWTQGDALSPAGQAWPGGYRFRPDGDAAPGGAAPDAGSAVPWGVDPAGTAGYRFRDRGGTPGWGAAEDPSRYRFRPLTEQEQNGRPGAPGGWRPSGPVPAAAPYPEMYYPESYPEMSYPEMSYPGTPNSVEPYSAPATGEHWTRDGPHPR